MSRKSKSALIADIEADQKADADNRRKPRSEKEAEYSRKLKGHDSKIFDEFKEKPAQANSVDKSFEYLKKESYMEKREDIPILGYQPYIRTPEDIERQKQENLKNATIKFIIALLENNPQPPLETVKKFINSVA